MMSNTMFILATFAMGAITFAQRAMPTLLPKKWLDSSLLHSLNEALPLAVMVLLILVSIPLLPLLLTWLPWTGSTETLVDDTRIHLIAQVLSLVGVVVIYHKTRQLLVAMVAGVLLVNLFLWLLGLA